MANQLPKAVSKALEAQLEKEKWHNVSNKTRDFQGFSITHSYNSTSGLIVHSFTELEPENKPEPTILETALSKAIADGSVVKHGISWYKFRGKNYNGKKAIEKALVEASK